MNEHERYKRVFSVLRASATIDLEAEMKHRPNYKKRLATLCVCAALILALTVSAFAVGGDTLKRLLGWDGHIEVHEYENEIGKTFTMDDQRYRVKRYYLRRKRLYFGGAVIGGGARQ